MRFPTNERLSSDIADGSPPGASGSERRCVLLGAIAPREALLRLAISPDGDVLPDPGAKAPGRGAWITPDRALLEKALAKGQLKGALALAFKGAALSIPADLADRVETALRRQLADRLGLEHRAGQVVLGANRIAETARAGGLALLLHARDASDDGRKKLDQAWRVGQDAEGSGLRGDVLPLDREALSVALGRDNVVHLGIMGGAGSRKQGGGAGARVAQAVHRLSSFIGHAPDEQSGHDAAAMDPAQAGDDSDYDEGLNS